MNHTEAKPQTTQRIYKAQLPWIKKCCKAFNKTFAELIEEWERQIKLHHQREFYNKLPIPQNYRIYKKLENVRINKIKKYRVCIQRGVAYNL